MVTWGNNLFGGDSGAVQDQLRDVQKIESTLGRTTPGDSSRDFWESPDVGGQPFQKVEMKGGQVMLELRIIVLFSDGELFFDGASPGVSFRRHRPVVRQGGQATSCLVDVFSQ